MQLQLFVQSRYKAQHEKDEKKAEPSRFTVLSTVSYSEETTTSYGPTRRLLDPRYLLALPVSWLVNEKLWRKPEILTFFSFRFSFFHSSFTSESMSAHSNEQGVPSLINASTTLPELVPQGGPSDFSPSHLHLANSGQDLVQVSADTSHQIGQSYSLPPDPSAFPSHLPATHSTEQFSLDQPIASTSAFMLHPPPGDFEDMLQDFIEDYNGEERKKRGGPVGGGGASKKSRFFESELLTPPLQSNLQYGLPFPAVFAEDPLRLPPSPSFPSRSHSSRLSHLLPLPSYSQPFEVQQNAQQQSTSALNPYQSQQAISTFNPQEEQLHNNQQFQIRMLELRNEGLRLQLQLQQQQSQQNNRSYALGELHSDHGSLGNFPHQGSIPSSCLGYYIRN